MGKIILENIEYYAFHGHLPEERKIGNHYRINVEIEAEIEGAGTTDSLDDTFDYRIAYRIVCDAMRKDSALLENIASRIMDEIIQASPKVQSVQVTISKMNPPLGGNVNSVSVEMKRERNK